MKKPLIQVIAPATTANMGPGYDCLGLALDLWNRLEVTMISEATSNEAKVEIEGEGVGELATGEENLVYRAMLFLFREADREIPPVRLRCDNQIPLERGLGSSAAAIAGGLVAANVMCGKVFSSNELLEMAATIEGHPDNVAAALHGGMQLVITDQDQLYTAAINVPPDMSAVLFIPELRIATADARAVLPDKVSMADAVYNMSRTALLVAGMVANRPDCLAVATKDRLHQPYRQPLFPVMNLLFRAALDAGALGVFLSGSGSTVLALAQGREMTVAYEMAEAARQASLAGRVHITRPTVQGAHVLEN